MRILKEKYRKPAWANVRFPVFLCKIKNIKKMNRSENGGVYKVKREQREWR